MRTLTRPTSKVYEQPAALDTSRDYGEPVKIDRLLARYLERSAGTQWRRYQRALSHGNWERAEVLEGRARQLEDLADLVQATFWKPDIEPRRLSASEQAEVMAILDQLEAEQAAPKIVRPLPASDHRRARYGEAALFDECRRVADEPPGNRNNVLASASFRIGQLVGSGMVDAAYAFGNLLSAALAAGLREREARGVIRSGLAAGARKPREPAA